MSASIRPPYHTFELTRKERKKVALKTVLAKVFVALGGEHVARWLASPSLTIIAYHRVLPDDATGILPYIGVKQGSFRDQLDFFDKHYEIVSLSDGINRLKTRNVDRPLLTITFDDGYRDNLTLALPPLREFGYSATVFVTTDCVEHGLPLWPDQIRSAVYTGNIDNRIIADGAEFRIPDDELGRIELVKTLIAYAKTLSLTERTLFLASLPEESLDIASEQIMLSWQDVRTLAANGITIGSHTNTHPILSLLPNADADREIGSSRAVIEEHLSNRCDLFAYPNGTVSDFTDEHVSQLKKAGYSGAVTTMRGINKNGADLFRLRRTGIYGTDDLDVVRTKLAIELLIS